MTYYDLKMLDELDELIADMQAADSPLTRAVWPDFMGALDWLIFRSSLRYHSSDEKNYEYLGNGLYKIQDEWKQYKQPMLFVKVVSKLDLSEGI